MTNAVTTPCIKVCFVDDASGLCLGCYRTLHEIARWSAFAPGERRAILAALPGRVARIDPAKLGVG